MSQHIPTAYSHLASHPQRMSLSSRKITSEQSAIKFVGKVHLRFVKHQPRHKQRRNSRGSFTKFQCARQKNANLKDKDVFLNMDVRVV